MRVKVTYGIDLNDAPSTAKTILEQAAKSLEKQLDLLKSVNALMDDQETVVLVPQILKSVSDEAAMSDASIKDALSLMIGFVKVLDTEGNSDEPQATEPTKDSD